MTTIKQPKSVTCICKDCGNKVGRMAKFVDGRLTEKSLQNPCGNCDGDMAFTDKVKAQYLIASVEQAREQDVADLAEKVTDQEIKDAGAALTAEKGTDDPVAGLVQNSRVTVRHSLAAEQYAKSHEVGAMSGPQLITLMGEKKISIPMMAELLGIKESQVRARRLKGIESKEEVKRWTELMDGVID